MAGFSPLGELQLYHPDLWLFTIFGKQLLIEVAIFIPATKITGTYLPDDITALVQVMLADTTFPRIMCKISQSGSAIQRFNCIGTQ